MKFRFVVALIVVGWSAAEAFAGTVSGTVIFEGKPPNRRVIDTKSEKFCEEMYKDTPLLTDSAIIGAGGEFAHIFVWIDNPPAGDYTPPKKPVVLTQEGCRYTVPVFGMMAGQPLEIHNDDDTTHNVRGFPKNNRIFNFGQPPGLKPRTRVFENPEHPLKIKCDVHAWMKSYCFVMEHPYFGVSGLDGTYKIADVPSGSYTLKAWHERLGEMEQTVAVGDAGAEGADFTFRRSAEK